MKKILLLGGTGAMGVYLTPELISMGYRVDVVSLDDAVSNNTNLRYIKTDAMNNETLAELLKNDYNAIVDFLIYKNPDITFKSRMDMLLGNTEHYIYLSSYRVYANEDKVITENSPRLLEASDNKEYLAEKTNEYSLYKAIGEDILSESKYKNWTVIRPAITYSKFRFQLTTLEANVVVYRMLNNKTLFLPEAAMGMQGTMSWAGDVAKMIARLILNKRTYCEKYTVATSEHHTWNEIADYYAELGNLKYKTVDTETFLNLWNPNNKFAKWQLMYDRLFDRIIDNSKILNITGLKQSELMSLKEGLRRELDALPPNYIWQHTDANDRMDAYLRNKGE